MSDAFNKWNYWLFKNLLKQIPEGSEFSLVLGSHPARIDQTWSSQKDNFEKLVQNMRPSYQTTDIGHSLKKAVSVSDQTKSYF